MRVSNFAQAERAEHDNNREIMTYLERIPKLRKMGRAFEQAAQDRFHSVVYVAYVMCTREGIRSLGSRRAEEILEEVNALYPSLPEIATMLLRGEKVEFPKLYLD